MLIGYARVSKDDGTQFLDLQTDARTDARTAAGVDPGSIYEDQASGKLDARPGLDACLEALRDGDTLVVRKLDRLGRGLRHHALAGQLVLAIFAALAEHERSLISERTIAGLTAARARGRTGGRPSTMTPAKVRLVAAAMTHRETSTGDLRPDAVALLAKAKAGR